MPSIRHLAPLPFYHHKPRRYFKFLMSILFYPLSCSQSVSLFFQYGCIRLTDYIFSVLFQLLCGHHLIVSVPYVSTAYSYSISSLSMQCLLVLQPLQTCYFQFLLHQHKQRVMKAGVIGSLWWGGGILFLMQDVLLSLCISMIRTQFIPIL